MKSKLLLFTLAMLAVKVCMAQSNQTQNAAALAVNSGEYFESYHMKDNWDSTWEVPLFPDNDCWTLDWQNGQGGLGMESADGVTWNEFFWPSNAWPVLPSGGAGVDWWNWNTTSGGSTYFWNIITNSSYIGPGLVQEHCIALVKWPTGDEQRTADAKMNLATGGAPGSTAMNLWVVSASAIGYTNLYDTEGYPIPFTNICAGVFGYLDASGNAYMLLPDNTNVDVTPYVPGNDHYSFSDPRGQVTLDGLTVSNATEIDATNWAAVKSSSTNDYVYVQAQLSDMSDTNAANLIQWSTGEKVPGNPFAVRVTKTNSVETTVTATLGSTNVTVKVWIVWSTMTIQVSGTKPSNAPSFENTFYPGDQLGIQYYFESDTNSLLSTNYNVATGKICATATITPVGIHSLITNGWDLFQKTMVHDFTDGARGLNNTNVSYYNTWSDDGPQNEFKTIIPDANDKLYALDGPNIGSEGQTSTEIYDNFYVYATWNSQMCSDTNTTWHFQGRWKDGQTPPITFIDLGASLITLPTNAYYPPP